MGGADLLAGEGGLAGVRTRGGLARLGGGLLGGLARRAGRDLVAAEVLAHEIDDERRVDVVDRDAHVRTAADLAVGALEALALDFEVTLGAISGALLGRLLDAAVHQEGVDRLATATAVAVDQGVRGDLGGLGIALAGFHEAGPDGAEAVFLDLGVELDQVADGFLAAAAALGLHVREGVLEDILALLARRGLAIARDLVEGDASAELAGTVLDRLEVLPKLGDHLGVGRDVGGGGSRGGGSRQPIEDVHLRRLLVKLSANIRLRDCNVVHYLPCFET